MTHRWVLPDQLEDLLPQDAWRLELARRRLLDLFRSKGYQLVVPPMMEFVDSLLSGMGRDLDMLTYRVTDQMSGRQMGLRADMTTQVARIDAHGMNQEGENRLCYAGSVLHTLPEGLGISREPYQVGAELYGQAGLQGDLEIQQLMLSALKLVGLSQVTLDVGHLGLFQALAVAAKLDESAQVDWIMALQGHDRPTLQQLAGQLSPAAAQPLLALVELNGDASVLAAARELLPRIAAVDAALDQLEAVASQWKQGVNLSFDLAELRGHRYHSGMVFTAYAEGFSDAVARGGRYDEVGRAFGRSRPATGFSLDLRELLPVLPQE
jgi:ATP phosphoribosyltransferase regulatory subunit